VISQLLKLRSTNILKRDLKDWVIRGYPSNLCIGRFGIHAVEEHPYLHLPTLQVCAENVRLLVILEFHRTEGLNPLTYGEFARLRHAEVSNPLSLPPWRDEIAAITNGQRVD